MDALRGDSFGGGKSDRLRAEAESQLTLLTDVSSLEQSDFYSYRYFASEGFLPGYNFPRLPLSAYIPGRRTKQRDEYLSRPRFLAISEFGPRAIVYHEGSRYLINRIENHPAITLRARTEITALDGNGHLERVQWTDRRTSASETRDIRHVFTMTGADPCTRWLQGCVALDEKGFIKTGPELSHDDLAAARWPLQRAPYLLETSLPGVFAVGDVRAENVKRVASAVGEGSIAISFVHRALSE